MARFMGLKLSGLFCLVFMFNPTIRLILLLAYVEDPSVKSHIFNQQSKDLMHDVGTKATALDITQFYVRIRIDVS